jgi:hypothetical protein
VMALNTALGDFKHGTSTRCRSRGPVEPYAPRTTCYTVVSARHEAGQREPTGHTVWALSIGNTSEIMYTNRSTPRSC